MIAERLVARAMAAGVRATIHRPVRVAWHGETGSWLDDDFLAQILEACIYLRAAPVLDWDIEIVPVEAVARGLARALERTDREPIRHWAAAERLPFPTLVDWLADCGAVRERVPFAVWRERLVTVGRARREHGLVVLARTAVALEDPVRATIHTPEPTSAPTRLGFERWVAKRLARTRWGGET